MNGGTHVKLRHLALALAGAAATLGSFNAAGAQERERERTSTDREFTWEGVVPRGRWLYVRNLNGAIRVERGSGDRTVVTGVKRWRRGDPEDVRIETSKVGSGDILICAIWYEQTECDEEGYHRQERRRGNDRNDVSVEFTVRVAEGVKLDLNTVNGSLRIDGASAEVEAHTVNGGIEATSSSGPVSASTVNGSIEVHMGSLGDKDLEFETVNGGIEVYVPDQIDAEVEMRTVNGSVSSDFPLTVSGRINPRHLRATIGKGGRRLEFGTVNGSVKLYKR
jgi:hypothetical protein